VVAGDKGTPSFLRASPLASAFPAIAAPAVGPEIFAKLALYSAEVIALNRRPFFSSPVAQVVELVDTHV
jgi:hypothetical protein